jgi:hypothetical protein
VDEVKAKFKQAEDTVGGGLLTFLIFFLSALVNLLIAGPFLFIAVIILGFVICFPIVLVGLKRIGRLRRLLTVEDPVVDLLPSAAQSVPELPEVPITAELASGSDAPDSVTEHTTFKLKVREPK